MELPLPSKVECTLPAGIAIKETSYGGLGVFATRPFKEGQIIWTNSLQYVVTDDRDLDTPIPLIIKQESGTKEHVLTLGVHAVRERVIEETVKNEHPKSLFSLYNWDSYMNHHCQPNLADKVRGKTAHGETYSMFALRDIAAGEELTCDYNLFYWDLGEHAVEVCKCGAKTCIGSIKGFSCLSAEVQQQRIGYLTISDNLVSRWKNQNPRIMVRRVYPMPDGLTIAPSKHGGMALTATREFETGELIFENTSEFFDSSQYDFLLISHADPTAVKKHPLADSKGSSCNADKDGIIKDEETGIEYIYCPNMVSEKVEFLTHTVRRGAGNIREFFGYDTFCNHSCDPSCINTYYEASANRYKTTAARAIHAGEELTIDYGQLPHPNTPLDGTTFPCNCGSPKCAKVVLG